MDEPIFDEFEEITNEKETQTASPLPDSPKKSRAGRVFLTGGIALISALVSGLGVYFSFDEELRSLQKLKNQMQLAYYEDVTSDQFYGTVFDAVNEKLLDNYSAYMTKEEYERMLLEAKGQISGIGLVFSTVNDDLRVLRVCGNSPAESQGVLSGDYVVEIGAEEASLVEVASFDALSAELDKYLQSQSFCLALTRNGERYTVTLSKEVYVENYVFYRTGSEAYRFSGNTAKNGGEPLACLDADDAYIRLTQFNGDAANAFDAAMRLFKEQGKKDLVLDLRGNGGGYLDIMLHIAQYFSKDATEKNPLAVVAEYKDGTDNFYAYGNAYASYFGTESRITVLADENTASASECLIGFMYDYGAIGYADICLIERGGVAKTFGKGIMQTTYPLGLTGDAVKLTTAQIRWPKSNHCIHGRGVLPEDGAKTVPFEGTEEAEIISAIGALSN